MKLRCRVAGDRLRASGDLAVWTTRARVLPDGPGPGIVS